jgi:hypothetical protein
MDRPPGMYPKFDAPTVTAFHRDKKSNKTGFLGVKYHQKDKCFLAYIRVHGRKEKVYCGRGKTPEEAARKYDAKAIELYGDGAVLNFQAPNAKVSRGETTPEESAAGSTSARPLC